MYFIFDFDGTLIETMNIDYILLKKKLKYILGCEKITPMYQIINSYPYKKLKCYDLIDKFEIDYLSNIKIRKDIINLYKNSKIKIILSRNGEKIIKKFFTNNNLPMPDFISSRDNCINLKPELEQIQIIFDKYNFLNKNNICIVGDSWHDEQLSKNVGCQFRKV
jgi:HAD superfamily hydrolase (TIGR01549 family)